MRILTVNDDVDSIDKVLEDTLTTVLSCSCANDATCNDLISIITKDIRYAKQRLNTIRKHHYDQTTADNFKVAGMYDTLSDMFNNNILPSVNKLISKCRSVV